MGGAVEFIWDLPFPVLKQIFGFSFEGRFKNFFGPLLEPISWQLSPSNAVSQGTKINGRKKFQP